MKYKYRMYYEPSPESRRPPDGWYVIKRKRKGLLGLLDMWWYVALGLTPEDARLDLAKKLKDTEQQNILIEEW